MKEFEPILLKGAQNPESYLLKNYLKIGGYKALEKALETEPVKIIEEVKKSKLVGRGGAGFPTGLKWELTRKQPSEKKYIICNADESEPGTFKDRVLLEKNPHLVIEGIIIAAYAIGAQEGIIFIRGEFSSAYRIFKNALEEAYRNNFLGKNILNKNFNFDLKIYRGAGAYMSGEETALLESIEGKRACARGKPPYPCQTGLFEKPTLVNNVETLCNIPAIVLNGADWYLKIGSSMCPGPKLFALSGDVNKPGVYELPLGINLRELIEKYGGGVKGEFKCVLPGSVSSRFLKKIDINLDYETLKKEKNMLGAGAVIVINKTRSIPELCFNIIDFFARESCGFCVPCRLGTQKSKDILKKFLEKKAQVSDLEILKELAQVMFDTCRCGLGQFALNARVRGIDLFREEFLERAS